ncbi:MAG: HAMP domain-containing histidine kinase [Sphingomonadales bacterium]|nr:HAMP domain-containing histidine kinase [Sphingomonadales bacterium]
MCLIGLVGMVLLLAFILFDYHITFGGLAEPRAFGRALHEVSAHVALPVLIITLPMGVAAYWTVQRALQPIEDAAGSIGVAGSAAPGLRIDDSQFPAEIAPLAAGVNALLARLEDAVDRNAAFSADIAHELRTPLTLLGLELEAPQGADAVALRGQVARMQKLVNQLMLIAQVDAAQQGGVPGRLLDLHAIAGDVVAQTAPGALAAGRQIALEDHGAQPLIGQEEAMAAALRNLVDNALRVTPPGGTVTVVVGPGCRLGVIDEGPGLEPAELNRLVSRHVRSDSASRDGAGLGLAIVSRIVAAHNGRFYCRKHDRLLAMEFDPG